MFIHIHSYSFALDLTHINLQFINMKLASIQKRLNKDNYGDSSEVYSLNGKGWLVIEDDFNSEW